MRGTWDWLWENLVYVYCGAYVALFAIIAWLATFLGLDHPYANLVFKFSMMDWSVGLVLAWRGNAYDPEKFRRGLRKLVLWAVILVVARHLHNPWGTSADGLLSMFGDYILLYVALVDLQSVLKHLKGLADIEGIRLPVIEILIDLAIHWRTSLEQYARRKARESIDVATERGADDPAGDPGPADDKPDGRERDPGAACNPTGVPNDAGNPGADKG